MKNIRLVRSFTDANKMMDLGHRMIKVDKDRNNSDYLVFIFENDITFRKDLDKLSEER